MAQTWTAEHGARRVLGVPDSIALTGEDQNQYDATLGTLTAHLRRGKSIAYYENEDLGHPMVGHVVAFTYGTPEAQFEGEPPTQCPDGLMKHVTGGINWRYQLAAVTKALPVISDPVGV